ncbi:MAG: hypothetical protein H6970_07245 [Gammaproteobacteria bacterium]|nr:hypothetical protein [Gammaproteobacteria bacterium]MCP5424849.1 hypothetical protein [Gammaproteobacteria bacterium]MCP5458174.1 hypothetical protein [Gammaproteobacteria bacterium]
MELASVPATDREKLRFELIKAIDSYGSYFTQWPVDMPAIEDATLRKQFFDTARQFCRVGNWLPTQRQLNCA